MIFQKKKATFAEVINYSRELRFPGDNVCTFKAIHVLLFMGHYHTVSTRHARYFVVRQDLVVREVRDFLEAVL